MDVKIKKLSQNVKIPVYAKQGDAGVDITATRIIEESEKQITYGTDVSIEIPEGYVGFVFPRSSIKKYELLLKNSVGCIDSGYRGELMAVFEKTNGNFSKKYDIGDRIFQLIILPFPQINLIESNELSETVRGGGGFGHTGK